MIIGESVKKIADGYQNDPMHAYAESFLQISENILTEAQTELYTDPKRALLKPSACQALKNFFVENSYDPAGMTPDQINDHIATMEQQFDNDKQGILENTVGADINPIIGMTFPMHKFILMNMVFDKGAIPKFVTRSPKFTISMEYRILVDTEGNELDMFEDQNLLTDAIEKTAAMTEFTLPSLPFTDASEVVHTYLGGLAGSDHLAIETYISAVKLDTVYVDEGDLLPDENGYITKASVPATADTKGVKTVWYPVDIRFTPTYNSEFDRAVTRKISIKHKVLDGADVKVNTSTDVIVATMNKDRLNVAVMNGVFEGVRVTGKLDTSNARATTCSVRWKQKTDIVEIGNAIPIDTTVSPEETKDIAALYNVNQVTKIMSMTKTVLGNYKDDKIKRELDHSYSVMDARSKTWNKFDWAPREGYHGDHVQWRRDTFLDFLDSEITKLIQVLNDPNVTVSVFGDPDIIRKITPVDYSYQTPANIGPVDLDFESTVVSSNKRVTKFIGSDKLRGNTELIITLCPRGTDRIIYRIYDYQMYMSNEIRNAANPALPNIHSFERWKFVSYQPVQGRVEILHPSGLTYKVLVNYTIALV